MSFKGKKFSDLLNDICHSGSGGIHKEDVINILSRAFETAWAANYGTSTVKIIWDNSGVSFCRVLENGKLEDIPLYKLSDKCTEDVYDTFSKELLKHQKHQEYLTFKELEGKIVTCNLVTQSLAGYVVKVNGSAQGLLDRTSEKKITDRGNFPCLLYKVEESFNGHQLFLDRKSNDFIKALLATVIPEIEKGGIAVKAVARIPGLECMVAVEGVAMPNPIGACLGYGSDRRNSLISMLNGEKITFVLWDNDIKAMIRNCFPRIKFRDIVFKDEKYYLVVDNNDMAAAIGTRGNKIKICRYLLNNIDLQVVRENELDSAGGINSYEKLAEEIANGDLELKHSLVSMFNANNGNVESEISNVFLPTKVSDALKKYYYETLVPREKQRFIDSGGEDKLFMFIPGMGIEFYFKILEAGIKTVDDLYEMNELDLSKISDYNLETCRSALQHVYKNHRV